MAYTTASKIEDYLQTEIEDAFEPRVESWIASATKWIDNYTDRTFEATSSLKKFDGTGDEELYVKDFVSISSIWVVTNDATSDPASYELSTTDYYLYQDKDPNRSPKNRILINPLKTYSYFPFGFQNIWITAIWGCSETVPADIELVATKLVASILKTGRDNQVSSFAQGDLSINYQDFSKVLSSDLSVKQILDWYKVSRNVLSFNIKRG